MTFWRNIGRPALLSAIIICSNTAVAVAAQSSSANYSVDETMFGSGGELNACSTSYCSKQTLGETAVGKSGSTNYQVQAGNNTSRSPYLQFIVNATSIDTGGLSTITPSTATATFSVKSYLSSGYVVVNASPPPQNGAYTMAAPSTPTASAAGTEQFGINVVANTSPATFGANPVQVPDSTFSFGQAATGYNTANLYKYVNGDTIAQSLKSSGETDYTISYLFNISTSTAAGIYTMNHVLVATATF